MPSDQQWAAHPGVEVGQRGGDVESSVELETIHCRRVEHLRHGRDAVAADDPEHPALMPAVELLGLGDAKQPYEAVGEIHRTEPRTHLRWPNDGVQADNHPADAEPARW